MKFTLFLFIVGVIFTVFNAFLIFKKGLAEKFQPPEKDNKYAFFTEKEGYVYYRYGLGVRGLIIGIGLMVYAGFVLLRMNGLI